MKNYINTWDIVFTYVLLFMIFELHFLGQKIHFKHLLPTYNIQQKIASLQDCKIYGTGSWQIANAGCFTPYAVPCPFLKASHWFICC